MDGRVFFIYDHLAQKKEEDDPKDSIVYFYPSTREVNEQCELCGQLMGISGLLRNFFSPDEPSVFNLTTEKYAVKHVGNYSMVLSAGMTFSDDVITSQLRDFYHMFTFYQGSIEKVYQLCGDNREVFLNEMTVICSAYLFYIRCYDDQVSSIFRRIPSVTLPQSGASLFLRASHILQVQQRRAGVLGGCILYKNDVLMTQLSPDLTTRLCIIRPKQKHLPCQQVVTNVVLPMGVRILVVYLSHAEYKQFKPKWRSYGDSDTLTSNTEASEKEHRSSSSNCEDENYVLKRMLAHRILSRSSGTDSDINLDSQLFERNSPVEKKDTVLNESDEEGGELSARKSSSNPSDISSPTMNLNEFFSKNKEKNRDFLPENEVRTSHGGYYMPTKSDEENSGKMDLAILDNYYSRKGVGEGQGQSTSPRGSLQLPESELLNTSATKTSYKLEVKRPNGFVNKTSRKIPGTISELSESGECTVVSGECTVESSNNNDYPHVSEQSRPQGHVQRGSVDSADIGINTLSIKNIRNSCEEVTDSILTASGEESSSRDRTAETTFKYDINNILICDSEHNVDKNETESETETETETGAWPPSARSSREHSVEYYDTSSLLPGFSNSSINKLIDVDVSVDNIDVNTSVDITDVNTSVDDVDVNASVNALSNINNDVNINAKDKENSDISCNIDSNLGGDVNIGVNDDVHSNVNKSVHSNVNNSVHSTDLKADPSQSTDTKARGVLNLPLHDSIDHPHNFFNTPETELLPNITSPPDVNNPRDIPVHPMSDAVSESRGQVESKSAEKRRRRSRRRRKRVVLTCPQEEVKLYIQGHSNIVLLLLLEPFLDNESELLHTLWKSSLQHLGDLEASIKDCLLGTVSRPTSSEYNYLYYDGYERDLQGNQIVPVSAQEIRFSETAFQLHEDFRLNPTMDDVTLRSHSHTVYGHQNTFQETYFQSNQASKVPLEASAPLMNNSMHTLRTQAKRTLQSRHQLKLL